MAIAGGGAAGDLDRRVSAERLYEVILRTSNHFLHNCRGFSVEILRLERPTYAEVAEIMRKVGRIVVALSDDFDPMMGQKAFEYCELMAKIGVAIDNNDQIGLERLVTELERRPGT